MPVVHVCVCGPPMHARCACVSHTCTSGLVWSVCAICLSNLSGGGHLYTILCSTTSTFVLACLSVHLFSCLSFCLLFCLSGCLNCKSSLFFYKWLSGSLCLDDCCAQCISNAMCLTLFSAQATRRSAIRTARSKSILMEAS